jgi:hypothetical protein
MTTDDTDLDKYEAYTERFDPISDVLSRVKGGKEANVYCL